MFVYDPGGTTGVATATLALKSGSRRPEADWIEELRETMKLYHVKMPNEQVGTMRLWRRLVEFEPHVVVGEDFRLFPDVPHRPDPRGTAPDRILAMMDLMLHLSQDLDVRWPQHYFLRLTPIWLKQMPSERSIVTDKVLRDLGLWRTPGKIEGAVTGDSNHAMDALRHLIVFARKLNAGKDKT